MSGPNGDLGMSVEGGAEGEDDGFGEAEYAAINSMLDQINSCLDHLEEKNDHLHARLQELLESNRQTRLEFQQQLGEAPSDASS
ncbi:bublin coiled-coil protein [Mustela putorius furo]|uniref:Bublin coiled-coil protein n=1 Tax=Mustela putorius furo TaxID=9669 RepID=A0A8U0MWV7_MUSPF|nr:bublin coiled-coil protein [Mustela putorius furo]